MIRSNRLIYNKGKGVSSETRPYSHLIYAACHEELNKYMTTNSYFYNFNKNIHIDWKQIKPTITNYNFVNYPIEDVRVNFHIKTSKKSIEQSSVGAFFFYQKKIDDNDNINSQSAKIKSQSKWNKHAYQLAMDISLYIPKFSKSIDIERLEKDLSSAINHELHHSYEQLRHDFSNNPMIDFTDKLDEVKFLYEIKNVWGFIMCIYYTVPYELNALLAQDEYFKSLDELKESDSWRLIGKDMCEFNCIEYYMNIKKDLRKRNTDIKFRNKMIEIVPTFGDFLYDECYKICKKTRRNMPKDIIKMKGMDLFDVLKYWQPIINETGEYIRRKLAKKIVTI